MELTNCMMAQTRHIRELTVENLRLRRDLGWAWFAICVLSFVAVGACLFAFMISRVG